MRLKDIIEVYQEEPGSTFQSDDKTYDVNVIFRESENYPVMYAMISDVDWVLKYDDPDISERTDIDINIPILVTYDNELLLVVDGVHRLKKSKEEGNKIIPCKFIDSELMNLSKI